MDRAVQPRRRSRQPRRMDARRRDLRRDRPAVDRHRAGSSSRSSHGTATRSAMAASPPTSSTATRSSCGTATICSSCATPTAMERDVVDYRNAGFTVPDGGSMALADPALDNGEGASWCASTTVMRRGDLGSPGAPNRCTAVDPAAGDHRDHAEPGRHRRLPSASTSRSTTRAPARRHDRVHRQGRRPRQLHRRRHRHRSRGGLRPVRPAAADNGGVKPDYAYGSGMRAATTTPTSSSSPTATACSSIAFAGTTARRSPTPTAPRCRSRDPTLDNALGAQLVRIDHAVGGRRQGHARAADVVPRRPGQQPIVITEVMFDPETPDSERNSEWFEIANLGEQSGRPERLDDRRRRLRPTRSRASSWPPATQPCWPPTATRRQRRHQGRLRLRHRRAAVQRKRPSGPQVDVAVPIVDRVDWSAAAGFPIPPGRSISLGFAVGDNALGANWCESTDRLRRRRLRVARRRQLVRTAAAATRGRDQRSHAQPCRSRRQRRRVVRDAQHDRRRRQPRRLDDDDGASDRHVIKGSPRRRRRRLPRARPRHRHRPQRRCASRLLVRRRRSCSSNDTDSHRPRRPVRHRGRRGSLDRAPRRAATQRRIDRARRRQRGARAGRSSAAATAARPARPTTARHCPIAAS